MIKRFYTKKLNLQGLIIHTVFAKTRYKGKAITHSNCSKKYILNYKGFILQER